MHAGQGGRYQQREHDEEGSPRQRPREARRLRESGARGVAEELRTEGHQPVVGHIGL